MASVDLSPEKSADAKNLLTAAGTAMLHLAQLHARTLGSNATVRREAILGMSVLERADAAFIGSQGIGTLDLLGGIGTESVFRGEVNVGALPRSEQSTAAFSHPLGDGT